MNVKFKSFHLSSLLTALAIVTPSVAVANPTLIKSLERTNAVVVKQRETGKVTFIGSNSPNGIQPFGQARRAIGDDRGNARSFVRTYAPSFGISNSDTDLTEIKSFKTDGLPTVKYQQRYNNIPIWGAELNVNLDRSGNLLSMGGETATVGNIDTNSKVTKAKAISTALKSVAKEYKVSESELKVSESELKIYQPGIVDSATGKAKLVWFVKIVSKKLLPIEQIVLVDAQKPDSIVLTFNNTPDARYRETYYTPDGLYAYLVCNEFNTSSNCVSPPGTTDIAKAHTYAGDAYSFYRSYHGRDSINGYGMVIQALIDYSSPYCRDAKWISGQNYMYFCGGFSLADDVVAHEYTHGVTQYTSGLIYYKEPGAINESFSDLWGEFVDLTNGKGNDTAAVRWKAGENIPGGAVRDMKNPFQSKPRQPDKMTSSYYYFGSADNGGVHINSGINNKAVYLMTDGGFFNGRSITGIGLTKVAKIYYYAQTRLLTSGTRYYQLYNYINQSCNSLIGTSGITASNCAQVKNALLAVEMNVRRY
jgi:bacillolysin